MLTWIDINKKALLNNIKTFQKLLGKKHFVPVIKSNAYGHGFDEVFSILKKEKLPWLCVNYLSEGIRLRKLGYQGNILIVGPADVSYLDDAFKYKIDLVMGNQEPLLAWLKKRNKPRIHIKIETGLSRMGFSQEELPKIISLLKPHKKNVVGILTHFANVEDVLDYSYASLQLERFAEAKKKFLKEKFKIISHAAASASALILNESRLDLSRVGISLYGFWPSKSTQLSFLQKNKKLLPLEPVLSWYTKVVRVKKVTQGDFVGYGCSYRANKDLTVAVLPVGYYEGYPRAAAFRQSYVLIHGSRVSILGRICMNMMICDVSHLKNVCEGDLVTLIGKDQDEVISAEDIASWADTINYEIVTRLNREIPRKII